MEIVWYNRNNPDYWVDENGNAHFPKNCKKIFKGAFSDCQELKTVIIPEGVKEIDMNAFVRCTNLTSVTLPSTLERIGIQAFMDATALENVEIPEGTQTIDENAFFWCKGLKRIVIPKSVEKIGAGAFVQCQNCSVIIKADSVGLALARLNPNLTTGGSAFRLHTLDYEQGIVMSEIRESNDDEDSCLPD